GSVGMASGAGSGGGTNPAAGSSSTSDGGEAGAHGADLDDTTLLEQARRSYAAWQKRTEDPQPISAQIFALCRGPTQAEEDFVASEHGDRLYLLDWIDPGAAAVFAAASSGPFPVGATIVKEKLVLESGGYVLHALGLMLKREPGFDPAHGDWQFGYWNAADGMIAGAAENAHCGNCHAGSSTDFVFMDASWHVDGAGG
ncbi:MAG TPA: cytochrome P460 family protein, partial [Polyangiaceae bacterium]|nr:cytochrome P460 family protein [Polyangiaceae bacterium]